MMQDPDTRISRRIALKGAAASGVLSDRAGGAGTS